MENIYMMADREICRRMGDHLRQTRLRQNITQKALADQAQISLSTVKKVEQGQIGSFDSLLRIMRILGELDTLSPLLQEEEMSPNEYLKFIENAHKHQRKRASSNPATTNPNNLQDSEW